MLQPSGALERALGEFGDVPPGDSTTVIDDLARLQPIEYDRIRKTKAKELGIRITTLDSEVGKLRVKSEEDVGSGAELQFEEPDPWPEAVNGAGLLDQIEEVFSRFIVLPKGAAIVQALWAVLTYTFDSFDVSPYLLVTSPEMRCGKTRDLEILASLVARPLPASNISKASLFRTIEKERPTLLIDEADTFLRESEELAGILNSGHRKGFAFVIRTVGDDHEPRRFSTWCPKAIAQIRKPKPTIEDRSIVISMRRKNRAETVEKFRARDMVGEFLNIRRKIVRWVSDFHARFGMVQPELPSNLGDRERDKWEPLVAIAEIVGGDWPQKVRVALESLGSEESSGESNAVQLLADLRNIFDQKGMDRLFSEVLVNELGRMEERPWPEWSKGRPITTRQLAALLKRFSVSPKSIRIKEETAKGYVLEDLKDPFSRYLSPFHPLQASQFSTDAGLWPETDPSQRDNVTNRKSPASPHQMGFVTDVTDQEWEGGRGDCLSNENLPESAHPEREPGDDTDSIEGGEV